MKHLNWLPLSAALLVMALAVPAAAKEHGQKRGEGHSYRGERSHSGKRESAERSEGRRGERRSYANVDRGSYRGDLRGGERRSYARADRSPARGSYRADRYRTPRSDQRADVRWRDAVRDAREYRVYRDGRDRTYQRNGRYYGDDYQPRVTSRSRSRYDRPSYASYRPRYYYTGGFHRPRFVHRSGFSLGISIGVGPAYGYRYFDPYCDVSFSQLGAYYDHCCDHRHAEVILLIDTGGYPVATCAYQSGDWVVDDCYDDRYDDGY
ncbi:MAG TPA: hypothetical protein VJY35_03960 [Candidatus Eisenbacteria bacterium]|nr:hypothetical protein [Candidatus Eisenbacteria bacterium]